jgi:hypothetical protein
MRVSRIGGCIHCLRYFRHKMRRFDWRCVALEAGYILGCSMCGSTHGGVIVSIRESAILRYPVLHY